MFGYVRPALEQMSQEQKELYKSAYCGLCHSMGKRHRFWSRFTLNYDLTFLAVLLYACQEDAPTVAKCCPVHPFRKTHKCLCGGGMDRAADVSMILTWHKLNDDVKDHGFWRGMPYRFGRRWFRTSYRRAAHANPEFDTCVRQRLEQLSTLEAQESRHLDQVAHEFASILSAAAHGIGSTSQGRILEQLLYHVGRWIYVMDAWDDLEEDQGAGRYNPLDVRFAGRAREEREYVAITCTHSSRLAVSAANLLDMGEWTPVVENILCVGLPSVQEAVLSGRWKEMKKLHKRRYAHERSI